jgi:alpha-glucosidase (family GH31 glycosyl hydrolase)
MGGNIELYFFIHGTAKQVIAEYHKCLGKSRLPPFWALGWQDASNNGTTESIKEQVQAYWLEGLPLETVYLTKPAYNTSLNFMIDKSKVADVPLVREKLHEINVKLIGYLDPTINRPSVLNDSDYDQILYRIGDDNNLFIKTILYNESKDEFGDNLVGKQDDKMVVYMDWHNSKTALQYWQTILLYYMRLCPVDGFWTTENEMFSQI